MGAAVRSRPSVWVVGRSRSTPAQPPAHSTLRARSCVTRYASSRAAAVVFLSVVGIQAHFTTGVADPLGPALSSSRYTIRSSTYLQELEQLNVDIVLDKALDAELCVLDTTLLDEIGNVATGLLGQSELLLLQRPEALDRELDLDLLNGLAVNIRLECDTSTESWRSEQQTHLCPSGVPWKHRVSMVDGECSTKDDCAEHSNPLSPTDVTASVGRNGSKMLN